MLASTGRSYSNWEALRKLQITPHACALTDLSLKRAGKKFVGGIRTDKAGTTLNAGWGKGCFLWIPPSLVWFCSGHWNYTVIIFKFISVWSFCVFAFFPPCTTVVSFFKDFVVWDFFFPFGFQYWIRFLWLLFYDSILTRVALCVVFAASFLKCFRPCSFFVFRLGNVFITSRLILLTFL